MGRGSKRKGEKQQRAAIKGPGRPLVAIVGRPNVGKSALFNRLTRSRLAIVEDVEGVTRDRLYADTDVFGRPYTLIDTGGFDPASDDPMTQSIAGQVKLALAEADVVICLVDGKVDPLPGDREAVTLLRESSLPVLYAANKVDNPDRALGAKEYYRLGLDRVFEVSALHGFGIGELEEALFELLPDAPPDEDGEKDASEAPRHRRVAIVGRPNAGKSSLVNRLLREDRQLVDDRPGTTVDSVDALYEDDEGEPLVLVDTAGIRRRRSVERGIEGLAVLAAMRAIERSDCVVLMIDAERGPAEQDTKIAGMALERGCAVVVALNKMDLLTEEERKAAVQRTREVLSFMTWAPIKRVSAKTRRGVKSLIQAVREASDNHQKRVGTGEVNRFFDEVLARHPPPTSGGRPVRLYFVTQARSSPPTFVVVSNHPTRVHFSYKRYVENQLRTRFGFNGTPLRVHYRSRSRRGG